jgi:hypothetical protein
MENSPSCHHMYQLYTVLKNIIAHEATIMGTADKYHPNNKIALQYMAEQLDNVVLPFIREHWLIEANEYRTIRDKQNEGLFLLMNKEVTMLAKLFKQMPFVEVKIMTSLNAKTNLIGESDIDIGIIIHKLNNDDCENGFDVDKFQMVANTLVDAGYVAGETFNPNDKTNQYFSFTKIIDNVEFEAKVRDVDATKIILKLHDQLDNHLTYEQQTLFTYGKYLFKQFDKQNVAEKTNGYYCFKKLIYEAVFSRVEEGFVFPFMG